MERRNSRGDAATRRRWRPARERLPVAVHRDVVDTLFGMALPILGFGVTFVAAALVIGIEWGWIPWSFAAAAAIVTAARLAILAGYRRARPVDSAALGRWERYYAAGTYAFGALVGLFTCWSLTLHAPLMQMIVFSLMFGFSAGVVARIAVRPVICTVSLLLATIPTAIGLALHATTDHNVPLHTQLFVVETVLVVLITALSLATVRHLSRTQIDHLITRHDLLRLAKHDALTGLANRLRLRERFEAAVAAHGRGGIAVHCLDLDGFKGVNDRLGHPAGDTLLREVARRLTAAVRTDDTVARLGGDEFVVIQTGIDQGDEAELLARRILRAIATPYHVGGDVAIVGVSIGVALSSHEGLDLDGLIACADRALYRSKSSGRGRLTFCSSEDAAHARGTLRAA